MMFCKIIESIAANKKKIVVKKRTKYLCIVRFFTTFAPSHYSLIINK